MACPYMIPLILSTTVSLLSLDQLSWNTGCGGGVANSGAEDVVDLGVVNSGAGGVVDSGAGGVVDSGTGGVVDSGTDGVLGAGGVVDSGAGGVFFE